jgi:hypothetical protein
MYASMDRAVHLRPTWAAGIAMHSTRIYNYESVDSENLKGWHTSDGMFYLTTLIFCSSPMSSGLPLTRRGCPEPR